MTEAVLFAARLRQAVQGCTLHMQGPVQAWQAIQEAAGAGRIDATEVAELALAACRSRLDVLTQQQVSGDDPRICKEQITIAFISALFALSEQKNPPLPLKEK